MAECVCGGARNPSCARIRRLPGLKAGFKTRLMEYMFVPSGCSSVEKTSGDAPSKVKLVKLEPGACTIAVMFVNGSELCNTTGTEAFRPTSTLVEPRLSTNSNLTGPTTTLNCCVALNGGTPLSVTITEMIFVLGAWAALGRHWNTPVAGSIIALVGAPAPSENTSGLGGRLLSRSEEHTSE